MKIKQLLLQKMYSFIVYELDSWPRDLDSDFTFKNCFIGGVKLTKNADPHKYIRLWHWIR